MLSSPNFTKTAYVWGSCEYGQLGIDNSSISQVVSPRALDIPFVNDWAQVSCGYSHTIFLTTDGEVYSCGCNEYQQLGHKSGSTAISRISALENHRIISISSGAHHSAAITYNGRLFMWGCNVNGQLGREGDDMGVKMVRSLVDHRIVQVSLGVEHSLVLTDTSRVFAFGANDKCQLGLGYASHNPVSTPQQLLCIAGLPIRLIVAGGFHSMVISVSGFVYVWGSNDHGELGLGYIGSPTHASYAPSVSDKIMNDVMMAKVGSLCVDTPTLVKALKGFGIVYAACGENFTVVLARDGRVFSFGAGKFGQLGHDDMLVSSPIPRQIMKFMGNEAIQIACGKSHTLVLVNGSGFLYSFGAGIDGQLGVGDTTNCLSPTLVNGKWAASTTVGGRFDSTSQDRDEDFSIILHLFTGGNHACILTQACVLGVTATPDDFRKWNPSSMQSILTLYPELVVRLRKSTTAAPLPAPVSSSISLTPSLPALSINSYEGSSTIAQQLQTVFSSLGCLSGSCLEEGESHNHFNIGTTEHGLDLDSACTLQSQIFQIMSQRDLRRLINRLLNDVLLVSRNNYPNIECLRGLLVLAVSDLVKVPRQPLELIAQHRNSHLGPRRDPAADLADFNSDSGPYPVLDAGFSAAALVLYMLASAINKLDPIPSKIFNQWLLNIQPRYIKRMVLNLNNAITYCLDLQPDSSDASRRANEENIRSALELMKRLHEVNELRPYPISYSNFYIVSLKDKINIGSAFVHWLQDCNSGGMRFFSFCDYPFVFDAASKAEMLAIEARLTMQKAMSRAQHSLIFQSFLSPLINSPIEPSSPYFTIVVRRDHLVSDTLTNLTMATPNDFKKLLRVQFENEEAVDDGGVIKEFFLLVMRDLLNPVYGMFKCYPESQMLWFSESTMESEDAFSMVGILCGLAIYNSIIVNLSFPVAMFRKLLNESPNLDDLRELDPSVGRSLQYLLDYEEDDLAEVFCLRFAIDVDYFGTPKVIPLVENGESISVTQDNKALYVDKYLNYVLNESCASSYKAFEKGFYQVCGGYSLKLFRPMELQALVVGTEAVDWNELRTCTTYEGVYWDRHPSIQWFWEILLYEFTVEQKRKFLQFLTGCDRVPIFGFNGLKILIRANNAGDNYLPVAHTCSNQLDLPLYSSKEIMKNKLALAVEQTEGFGLV